MQIALIISTLVLALVTFLPLMKLSHWVIRDLDFPRVQIAFLLGLNLFIGLLFLNLCLPVSWLLIVVNLICLARQGWWILPYSRVWPKEVKPSKSQDPNNQICIMTSNVLTPNRNSQALLALVEKHQPDILLTLETDNWWQQQLAALEDSMPYTIKQPLDNLYGMHLYSRLPIENSQVKFLVQEGVPSFHLKVVLPFGQKVKMHLLHPAPPSPTENTESTQRDIELLIVATSVAKSDEPVIVTGDLNDVAWSRTTRLFRKISGLLDPRIGRGTFNTFHADYPLLRWPLDHLFHSAHFSLQEIKTLTSIGSDHFPLLTRLAFEPDNAEQHSGLEAENKDYQIAKELIQ
ncbi:endonuclease/exonuclease/phosphatase family protein [Kangiella sp. TOML190]|uniref:endonuclease/exonuclease/phosphatase family protein n=1 Tax=Kangiella sp. TOML190 TaxID=2931351 RepID=UPI00204239B5|nr:endonuclease/exonuclease/phosphatase family protein [Kangiella sp. TOML190]